MKKIIFATVFVLFNFSAMAACRLDLETRGLSPSQVSEVKAILAKKNFTVAKRLQGNEMKFYVRMYQTENCLPGISSLYEHSGGFQLEAPAVNLDIERTFTSNRLTFRKRLFQALINNLSKIPVCH